MSNLSLWHFAFVLFISTVALVSFFAEKSLGKPPHKELTIDWHPFRKLNFEEYTNFESSVSTLDDLKEIFSEIDETMMQQIENDWNEKRKRLESRIQHFCKKKKKKARTHSGASQHTKAQRETNVLQTVQSGEQKENEIDLSPVLKLFSKEIFHDLVKENYQKVENFLKLKELPEEFRKALISLVKGTNKKKRDIEQSVYNFKLTARKEPSSSLFEVSLGLESLIDLKAVKQAHSEYPAFILKDKYVGDFEKSFPVFKFFEVLDELVHAHAIRLVLGALYEEKFGRKSFVASAVALFRNFMSKLGIKF